MFIKEGLKNSCFPTIFAKHLRTAIQLRTTTYALKDQFLP